eukprot:TRINITY_DN2977_c0_g1_i2.p1 TRINITY_DN2977_c0_g1~~TRINITY_DN2977_c0_g1_i2.p1  ORF type:complete len:110 (+),score=19.21 TRINITY_DN2977_c0_g1_i2:136-465(+)
MAHEFGEVKQSGAYLLAASKQIGKWCDDINDQFIICKAENPNPAFCIDAGKKVTACALSVFERIDKVCKQEFDDYGQCLDKSQLAFSNCRKPRSDAEEKYNACLARNNL